MATNPIEQLRTALHATQRLVDAVRDPQWTDPTPCSDWTVRDLVLHLVIGNDLFASVLRGETPRARDQIVSSLGDLPSAFGTSSDALVDAFGQPGVLQRTFRVPVGPVPGMVALHLRIVEALVHGWDLARATGQQPAFSDDVVEQELTFSRQMLGQIPADRKPFAPPQPVPETAPPLDRLAALLGRTVPSDGAGQPQDRG